MNFFVMNFEPVKRVTYHHGLEQPFQLRRVFCHLLHLPDTLGSDREKRWAQSWELYKFAQFCMIRCLIQKLCRIGKSWKPLRKLEAGEATTFVLKRIRIQQRFRFATKIVTVCFGLFEPNRAIAPVEYSLPFLKSENHLRNPLKQ